MYSGNLLGFGLAVSSSAFIGSSFIIKKKGLLRAAASGTRARSGGYGYLLQPLWWIGMFTMVVGEFANFVALIYAPAVLVTPLGALSIIVSAVLAHFLLNEKLRKMGILGCVLCIVGSTVIVLHAPAEHSINSVEEIWDLAMQPAFLLYTASAIAVVLVLVMYCEPRYGQSNMMVYIGVCSINGSITLEHLSFYLIDMCLVDYGMLKFPPSLLAAAAIFTANCILNRSRQWTKTCEVHSSYAEHHLLECSKMMALFMWDYSKDGESHIVEWNESEGAVKRTYMGFRKRSLDSVMYVILMYWLIM